MPSQYGPVAVNVNTGALEYASGSVDSTTITDGSIVNADVNASAAIAYSKLNLATSIVNADVSASAAIAKTKLASLDVVNADVNSSAAIAYSKLNLATSIVNADVNANAALAYSKLNLATSIVNADVSTSAAITAGKLSIPSNPASQSLVGWNYDPSAVTSSTIWTAMLGILQLYRVTAAISATVANLYIAVATIGGTVTNGYMGLYNSSGTLLAGSADQSATWAGTTGVKTAAISGQAVTAGTNYYIGLLVGGATTAPTFARSIGGASQAACLNAGLTAATLRAASTGSSLTALPDPVTMSSNAVPTSGVVAWVAMGV